MPLQTLRANGMNPIATPCRIEPRARSPAKQPAPSLFSPPQAAEIARVPNAHQAPSRGIVRRPDAIKQQIYDVRSFSAL